MQVLVFQLLNEEEKGQPSSMKNFVAIFGICYVLSIIFLFFGGFLVFENLYLLLALISLIIAILVTVLMYQDDRIETLEKKIKKLDEDGDKDLEFMNLDE